MSSDSEDDCYGNVAQKLQSMKNKYRDDKIECTNLLNESATSTNELDEIVKKASFPAKTELSKVAEVVEVINDTDPKDNCEDFIDNLLANASTKRVTTASAKKRNLSVVTSEINTPKPSRRKKRVNNEEIPSNTDNNVNNRETEQNRGRGRSSRGQGRRNRGRGRGRSRQSQSGVSNWLSQEIPTFSVGNTDEYPDQSNEQQLFSNKNNDVVVIEEDPLDVNEELSVKVYWQNTEFFKFNIRKYQKLTQIFDYFAKKENISNDKVLLTYNDKVIKLTDTPDSIKYNIVKFIDGGIVNQSISKFTTIENKPCVDDGIRIKFQCQNIKLPFVTTIKWEEKLSLAMMKCSEHFELPINKLRFEFDGDTISGNSTPREMELEGGECIDVKVTS
ncbi:uncharacterized protein LOC131852311 [Achroia grisella]|uniref:uncharacterized protein LOC131852311 n=1 Tax=Achroia grisella TaxID=688607 RepID=UPI0027D34215|nr:uncharacterized protein LOC131852311 [Achroia grisella]